MKNSTQLKESPEFDEPVYTSVISWANHSLNYQTVCPGR